MNGQDKIYEMITSKIIGLLEKGVVPWHKPWATVAPQNMISRRAYRGINSLLLSALAIEGGYPTNYWMTFKQVKSLGGRVKAGERSTQVVFWKVVERKVEVPVTDEKGKPVLDDDGEPVTETQVRKRFILRYYSVFNLAQTENIDEEKIPATPENENGVLDRAQELVDGYIDGSGIDYKTGGDRACYSPTFDTIELPTLASHETSEEFYSTNFHEFIHSTGHEKRLKRDLKNFFGSEKYSQEELVAEMGACFLSASVGITEEKSVKNSAGYIQGWLKKLKSDRKLVVIAAAQAHKAADFVHETAKTPLAAIVTLGGKVQV